MTIEFWQVILITLIPAAFGAFGAWLSIRGQAGKTKAEEQNIMTGIALDLLKPYQDEQVKHLKRIEVLEDLIVAKNGKIADLTGRVEALENIVDVKDGTIAERDAKIAAQASQIATLQEQVRRLQCEVDALRSNGPDWKPEDGERRKSN